MDMRWHSVVGRDEEEGKAGIQGGDRQLPALSNPEATQEESALVANTLVLDGILQRPQGIYNNGHFHPKTGLGN